MKPCHTVGLPRVLLIEGSREVGQRLRGLIEDARVALVVGETDTTGGALALLREHRPDAVVLSMNLSEGRGCALLLEIKQRQPGCVAMVLSNFLVPEFRTLCLQLGADHFFDKAREYERVPEVLAQLGRPQPTTKEFHATG